MSSSSDPIAEARIENVEVRIAHLEDTVLKLSEELAKQQQVLERQVERYRQLLDQVTSEPTGASATQIEIPPHY